MLALVGAITTTGIECSTDIEYSMNDIACIVLDGVFLFMTIIFGAGFGIALSQQWDENIKKKGKS